MIGIIEFKKDTHERNKDLARRAKEAICELYESMHMDAAEHRIPREEYDERRGRSGMRSSDGIGPYGHRMPHHDGYYDGYREPMRGGYSSRSNYPFHGMDGQGQFEGRFTE